MASKREQDISKKLLRWYRKNKRSLPWRGIDDPYLIWVSEVMLQQTQVGTVIPYFLAWRKKFPDLNTLAAASEEEVLKLWEGLGYYSRARNLKKAAKILMARHNGQLPDDPEELNALPGIGACIAAAIASIAFGKDVPALEANGIRVLARLNNFHEDVTIGKNKKFLREKLSALIPTGKAGDLNQAVMDLGSAVCLKNAPKCNDCPLAWECLSFKAGSQDQLPVKKAKPKKPHYRVVAAIIEKNQKVLITKRPANGLLGGLWEFPGGKVEKGETDAFALSRELNEELGIRTETLDAFGKYQHAYTHFSVTVYAYYSAILEGKLAAVEVDEYKWVAIQALEQYPMGKVDRAISNDLFS